MIIGYAWMSTKGKVSSTSLDEQVNTLKSNGCEDVVLEQGTGMSLADRPLLIKLLYELKRGDTFVVCKLDRLTFSYDEGIQILKYLFDMGVKVYILNVGLLDKSAVGHFFIQTLAVMADFTRTVIREHGRLVCPKKFTDEQLECAYRLKTHDGFTYQDVQEMTSVSKSTLLRYIRRRDKMR